MDYPTIPSPKPEPVTNHTNPYAKMAQTPYVQLVTNHLRQTRATTREHTIDIFTRFEDSKDLRLAFSCYPSAVLESTNTEDQYESYGNPINPGIPHIVLEIGSRQHDVVWDALSWLYTTSSLRSTPQQPLLHLNLLGETPARELAKMLDLPVAILWSRPVTAITDPFVRLEQHPENLGWTDMRAVIQTIPLATLQDASSLGIWRSLFARDDPLRATGPRQDLRDLDDDFNMDLDIAIWEVIKSDLKKDVGHQVDSIVYEDGGSTLRRLGQNAEQAYRQRLKITNGAEVENEKMKAQNSADERTLPCALEGAF